MPAVPAGAAADLRRDLVSGDHLGADGRAVLPRAALRPGQPAVAAADAAAEAAAAVRRPPPAAGTARRPAGTGRRWRRRAGGGGGAVTGGPGRRPPMVLAEARAQALRPAGGAQGHRPDRVERGEVMCVIGPSGSGKSTFLRCINHLEQINAGRLWVDGVLVGYRQRGDKLYELRESEVAAAADRRRDGLPALQPVPAHDRARQRGRGAAAGEAGAEAGGARAGPGAAGPGRARRQGGRVPAASCPAASSSGWRSPGRWRCGRS